MLGLAVGIDYALFIVSRHRDQLRAGHGPARSRPPARSATAGSAVVFAGLTVMIALCRPVRRRHPVPDHDGRRRRGRGAIAVLDRAHAAAGAARLRRRAGWRRSRLAARRAARPPTAERTHRRRAARAGAGAGCGWSPRCPVLTIARGHRRPRRAWPYPRQGPAARPARPTAPPTRARPQRVSVRPDQRALRPGLQRPADRLAATIVGPRRPARRDGRHRRRDPRPCPGVASVPLATPNADAHTGIVQVIPDHGPDSAADQGPGPADPRAGAALAATVRRADRRHRVHRGRRSTSPTGSAGRCCRSASSSSGCRWSCCCMVFRSIAVPIKATIGFLLSVGAAFGATSWSSSAAGSAGLLNVARPGR